MKRILSALKGDPRAQAALVAAGILLAIGVAAWLRRPLPPETKAAVTVSSHATSSAELVQVEKERVREVTTRPDGTRTVRTSVRETKTDAKGERHEEQELEAKVEERPAERRLAFLGLNAAAEWGSLQVAPTGYRLGVDVPIGELLGLRLRAGAEVHLPGNKAIPDGAGLTVRIEIP